MNYLSMSKLLFHICENSCYYTSNGTDNGSLERPVRIKNTQHNMQIMNLYVANVVVVYFPSHCMDTEKKRTMKPQNNASILNCVLSIGVLVHGQFTLSNTFT